MRIKWYDFLKMPFCDEKLWFFSKIFWSFPKLGKCWPVWNRTHLESWIFKKKPIFNKVRGRKISVLVAGCLVCEYNGTDEIFARIEPSLYISIILLNYSAKPFLHIGVLNAFNSMVFNYVSCKNNPGWALIDIQSFSALIQRFLRFQRCSELNQPILILTSLVITDSVMNISEHLWFSVEHYWQAANRQRPWKKPKQVFFFNIDAEETRNRNFLNNF